MKNVYLFLVKQDQFSSFPIVLNTSEEENFLDNEPFRLVSLHHISESELDSYYQKMNVGITSRVPKQL